MTVRKIVIPIRGDGKGENVLAHAAVLARRYGAHVEALHCRPRAQDLMPYGVPIPAFLRSQIEESAESVADQEEKTLYEEFTTLLDPVGLTLGEGAATASWREAPGKQIDVIKANGRLADLVVVAKPDRSRNLGGNTLKAALFNTGRSEAARAVALTEAVVTQASEVTVLSAGEEVHGATADDLIQYLKVRGVNARLERFESVDGIGQTLLRRCKELSADTLIMGAYGDSHERETVFGGNTQTVVDQAEMPVIFVH